MTTTTFFLKAAAALLVLLLSGDLASAGTIQTDPRCAGYTCALDKNRPFDPAFCSDPSTCSNGTECPKCLASPEWRARIETLKSFAPRDFDFYLLFNNWLSSEISDTIAKIILQEVMGLQAKAAPGPIDGSMDILCCTETVIEFEMWPSGRFPSDDGYFTLSSLPAGYEGGSQLFVPGYMAETYPLSTSYNAYKYLSDYASILPRGMSTDCRLLIVNQTLGCVPGNYYCDTNTWTNTTCVQGRYVPPQCQADPTSCQEIYHAEPGWDISRFEALIKNTGLKFVIAYLGASGLPLHVAAMAARRESFVFYWYEPDPLPASVDGRPINFPPHSYECEQKNLAGNGDPTLSGFDCAYPNALLLKMARRKDMTDAGFKHFFDSFTLTSSAVRGMLAQHYAGGGTRNVWNLSCSWVQDNFATWQSWILPAPSDPPAQQQLAPAASATSVVIPAVVIPVGTVVIIGAVVAIIIRARAAAAVKYAPKKPPFALVFTDVESSTRLWETYGNDMSVAMETHHRIIREVIEQYQCYEVKTIGDSFMIACPSVLDATMLCCDIQNRLFDTEWPATIVSWKEVLEPITAADSAATDVVNLPSFIPQIPTSDAVSNNDRNTAYEHAAYPGFRGLHVRMGVHLCQEVEAKFDVIHQRYDYYGHDVNMAARVESAAHGGQILMTAETTQALQDDEDFRATLRDECHIQHVSKGLELKGVAEPVSMFSVIPKRLAVRRFPAFDNAVVDRESDPLEDSRGSVAASVTDSSRGSGNDFGRGFSTGVRSLFAGLQQNKRMQDQLLQQLCKDYGVASRGAPSKRINLLIFAMRKQLGEDPMDNVSSTNDTKLQSMSAPTTPKHLPASATQS
jgi:class 3 adenylate cyclase